MDKERLERELEQRYINLGKLYYEKRFEDPLEEVLPLFDAITELNQQLYAGLKKCEKCGRLVEEKSLYCTFCGDCFQSGTHKGGINLCRQCKRELTEGAAFCSFCGTQVIQ